MKERSPWLMYAGVLLSGGLWAFPWIILLMHDLNRIKRRQIFPMTRIAWVLSTGLAAYFFSIFILPSPGTIIGGMPGFRLAAIFILGLGLLLFIVASVFLVYRHITEGLETEFHLTNAVLFIVLTILVLLSLPILQRRLNVLIRRTRPPL